MITLTGLAVSELKRLVREQRREDMALRVFVSSEGCCGMNYGMAFDDEHRQGDEIIQQDGLTVWVDEMSAMHLAGAEIDYVHQLVGGGFAVRNPNAVKSCACGRA